MLQILVEQIGHMTGPGQTRSPNPHRELRLMKIATPLNGVVTPNCTAQKQMQQPFILKYKLDNCVSDFREVGVTRGKGATNRT